jgi:hypothetical protein
MGECPAREPEAVTQPRTRILYPTDFGSPDHCAGLCDWYTGSSQPLWFDFFSDGPSESQVFHRFKINIDDLDLPTIPLRSEGSFSILQRPSMTISPYRICGNDVSIFTWGINGAVLHAGSSLPDDIHRTFFLSHGQMTGTERRQISFCPISGRLCFISRRDIRIIYYSTSPLESFSD